MLLGDVESILHMPRIVNVGDQHEPSDKAFLALCDLYRTFSTKRKKESEKRLFPLGAPKLLFYASNLGRMPRGQLRRDLSIYRDGLSREETDDGALQEAVSQRFSLSGPLPAVSPVKPTMRIEEISRGNQEVDGTLDVAYKKA